MVRELVAKEVAAVKGVLGAMCELVHPKLVMKRRVFDRPLDDLGQPIDEVERQASAAVAAPASKAAR